MQRGVDLAAPGAGPERDAVDQGRGGMASDASSRSCGRRSASASRSTFRR
jgi:hypothetical protein